MNRWSSLLAAAAALLVAGCAGTPQQYLVKEVNICAAEKCDAATAKYSGAQLLAGFQQLLKLSEGSKVAICDADPTTRACKTVGICHLVLGGIIPGNGCAEEVVFSEIAMSKQAGQISLKANMPRTFIGTPLTCATMTGTLSVRSADEISLDFEPYYCNWMVVGNMIATFNFAVESLDLDRGQIGGYWRDKVEGTGNGSGSGYAVLKFPKNMPRGENWTAAQP